MRAAFWIKAFVSRYDGSEYKVFNCQSQHSRDYCICLLNSSLLFWWYWICVSDGWHITRKELIGFKVPIINGFSELYELASNLENKLKRTKKYVGTKQTKYEYKHKKCADEIQQIDNYINTLYQLSDEENIYIKKFAYRYRIGEDANSELMNTP